MTPASVAQKEYPALEAVIPQLEDLWFRQALLADEPTMAYNHSYGGTLAFPREKWQSWHDRWIVHGGGKRLYRYLKDFRLGFVGEIACHLDPDTNRYMADVLVKAEYRGRGFGSQGLALLCCLAKENGVEALYDDIAIDNPAAELFKRNGFVEEYRTEEIILVRKCL